MTDDVLTAILGGTLLTVATVAIGYLYRRVHEMRDRIRDLEAQFEVLAPITKGIRERTEKAALDIVRRRRHA